MKKITYLAVAAIAALSSCSSDGALNGGTSPFGGTMEFTATTEGDVTSRSTLLGKTPSWEVGDAISINGTDYTAASAGTSTTFSGNTVAKVDDKYKAYFPKTMYSNSGISLPASYTYADSKYNMPMYAESTDNNLAFKNLTGVIALTVPSTEMTTVKTITVTSDQHLSGACTINYNSGAPTITWTNTTATDAENTLTIDCGEGVSATTFYIPVPAGSHKIAFTVTDGSATKTMTAKSAISIARNKLYTLNFEGTMGTTKANINGTQTDVTWMKIGGTKWATMNVGATTVASSPETCYGDYYAWGEVKPYATNVPRDATTTTSITSWSSETTWGGTTGTKSGYNWTNYCNSSSFSVWSTEPYDGNSKVLTSAYDAATANWGSGWRTPTKADFEALQNACTGSTSYCTPTTVSTNQSITAGGVYWLNGTNLTIDGTTYGVKGILYVDKTDTSKRVFFPAAGICGGTQFYYGGSDGGYWSSSLYTSNTDSAYILYFISSRVFPSYREYRYFGFSVRPVSE